MKQVYLVLMLFILPSLCSATTGYPGINISLGAYYGSTHSKDNQSDTSSSIKTTNLKFALGTTHSEGMYIGTIYDLYLKNDGGGNLQDSNAGFSVGFSDKGSYIIYHYFFKSNYQSDSTTQYQGSGMGLDIGYQTSIGSGFSLGGQFSYQKINFKEKTINGEKTGADYSRETILPSLVFGFSF